MYNVNKSYTRDTTMKSLGHLEKIGVVRYHDTYKQMWKTRAQSKKVHGKIALKPSLSVTRLSVK